VALQHLTPPQRAILLLREVLEWDALEVAEWLDLSVPAVNSALQRARRSLQRAHLSPGVPSVLASPQVQPLLDRYVALWEQADIPGLVALLREDAWFSMPPIPTWFQGRTAIATFFQTTTFTFPGKWRLLPTCANASPAFGVYRWHAVLTGHLGDGFPAALSQLYGFSLEFGSVGLMDFLHACPPISFRSSISQIFPYFTKSEEAQLDHCPVYYRHFFCLVKRAFARSNEKEGKL